LVEQIVEIGNFVYDSFAIVEELGIKQAIFICGIGKATKVMQGYKNTHNRFGSIDFELLRDDIDRYLGVEVDIDSTKTVKGISSQLQKVDKLEEFYNLVKLRVKEQIEEWFTTLNIDIRILK